MDSEAKVDVHTALDEVNDAGKFVRKESVYRNFVSTASGAQFPPEKDRYHLYISYACPWANRCLTVLHYKGLQNFISVSGRICFL
jgi:glutathionyl-hydroquinone reductase